MLRLFCLASIFSLFLGARTAPPSREVPETILPFAENLPAALEEARERNVPLLVLDFDGWSNSKGQEFQSFYDDAKFLAAADLAVLVLASQHNHERRKELRDGKEVEVCAEYGGVDCKVHRNLLNAVYQTFFQNEDLVSPLFLVANPEGKELERHEHEADPGEVVDLLTLSRRQIGPGIGRKQHASIGRALDQSRKSFEQGDLRAAFREFCSIELDAPETGMGRARAVLERDLTTTVAERRSKLELAWVGGTYREALLGLDELLWSCEPHKELSRKCKDLLESWTRTPEGKALARDLKDERKARDLYEKGETAYLSGDTKKARKPLEELVEKHPGSKWADLAQGILAVLDRQH